MPLARDQFFQFPAGAVRRTLGLRTPARGAIDGTSGGPGGDSSHPHGRDQAGSTHGQKDQRRGQPDPAHAQPSNRLTTTVSFCPPNPNELLRQMSTFAARATLET